MLERGGWSYVFGGEGADRSGRTDDVNLSDAGSGLPK